MDGATTVACGEPQRLAVFNPTLAKCCSHFLGIYLLPLLRLLRAARSSCSLLLSQWRGSWLECWNRVKTLDWRWTSKISDNYSCWFSVSVCKHHDEQVRVVHLSSRFYCINWKFLDHSDATLVHRASSNAELFQKEGTHMQWNGPWSQTTKPVMQSSCRLFCLVLNTCRS